MEDGVFPTIYTEKKDGVQPEFDIRTDRFEVAIDAVDKINQAAANQVAKNKGETGMSAITMPDNQKIKLTALPSKNIDDERTKILAAPSTSDIVTGKQIGRAHV